MSHFRPMLAEHGLTEQKWRVLRVLQEQGPLDFTQVAELACLLRPSLTRISKNLIDEQLIKTYDHPEDGRRALLEITPQGAELIEVMTPKSAEIYARLRDKIGEEDFVKLVQHLEEALNKL